MIIDTMMSVMANTSKELLDDTPQQQRRRRRTKKKRSQDDIEPNMEDNEEDEDEIEIRVEKSRPAPHPSHRQLARSKSLFFEPPKSLHHQRLNHPPPSKHLSRMNSYSSLYSIPEDKQVVERLQEFEDVPTSLASSGEEARVFHRSPVSFANGYRKVELPRQNNGSVPSSPIKNFQVSGDENNGDERQTEIETENNVLSTTTTIAAPPSPGSPRKRTEHVGLSENSSQIEKHGLAEEKEKKKKKNYSSAVIPALFRAFLCLARWAFLALCLFLWLVSLLLICDHLHKW
jgi:hypothetical protein